MNKVFILGAMTAVALASCSNDKVEEATKGQEISFRASVGLTSRGSEVNLTNLGDLTIDAFQVGDGSQLIKNGIFGKKDGSSNSWESKNGTYYWPFDNAAQLRFYVYNADAVVASAAVSSTVTDFKITGLSPEAAIKDQKDLVVGSHTTAYVASVPLNLEHAFSQVEINAINKNEAYTIEVTDVKIYNVNSTGDFKYIENGNKVANDQYWSNLSTKTDYQVTEYAAKTLTANSQSLMGADGNAMLVPQQLTAWDVNNDKKNTNENTLISVKVKITTKSTGVLYYEGWAAVGIGTKWEAGKKYIYTLDFSNGAGYVDPKDPDKGEDNGGDPIMKNPIKFTVTVTDWVNSSENTDMTTK